MPFKTKDKINDKIYHKDCKKYEEGPWWVQESCHGANLNGQYFKETEIDDGGIHWIKWPSLYIRTLSKTTMMIRRVL